MVLSVASVLLLVALPSSPAPVSEGDPRLEASLKQLRVQAAHYADAALRFTSDETIRFHHQHGREEYAFRYFYHRRDDGVLDDFRQAASRRGPQSLNETGLPSVLRRPYSWVFLFDSHHAAYYDYEWVGARTVDRRPALGIRAMPRPPYVRDVNEWVAIAWVSRDTGELLQVDAIHIQDHGFREAYRKSQHDAGGLARSYTFEEVVTVFGVQTRELRLPSEVRLIKVTHGPSATPPRREYLVRQIYRNYRFYAVEARMEGSRPSRSAEVVVEPPVPGLAELGLPEPASRMRSTLAPLALSISQPRSEDILQGPVEIRWSVSGSDPAAGDVEHRVYLEPYPHPVCHVQTAPYVCTFDAGSGLQSRAIRVEAWTGGRRQGTARVRTKGFPRPELVERFTLHTSAVITGSKTPPDLEAFNCTYGGEPCRVVSAVPLAERPSLPVSLEILVDTSSSMRTSHYEMLEAARRVIDEAPGAVSISVAEFSTHYTRLGDFTSDRAEAERAIGRISGAFGKQTCLYNSMRRSLAGLGTRPGHRVLFVISDGRDGCGGGSLLDTVGAKDRAVELSREVGAPIYTYTLRQPTIEGRSGGDPATVVAHIKGGLERHGRLFEGLAAETGGVAVSRSQFTTLAAAFEQLLRDLASTWILDIDVDAAMAEGAHRLKLQDPGGPGLVRYPLYPSAGGHEASLIAMLESPVPELRWFALERLEGHTSLPAAQALGRALDREPVPALREAQRRVWVRCMAVLLVHGGDRERRRALRLLERDPPPAAAREALGPYIDLASRRPGIDERDAARLREWLGPR